MISKTFSIKVFSLLAMICLGLATTPVRADSPPANPAILEADPWEKFSVSLGGFFSNTNSNVRVGSGVGVDVDVEDVLGLDAHNNVFRADAVWRFSRNRKHRLDATWFALRRSATRTVTEDFDINDENGNTTTITAGSQVDTKFNLNIIETAYSWSFVQNETLDLAVVGGLYLMPINFELHSTGGTNADANMNVTAPLPVAGLRMDVAITPRLFVRTGTQFFYIEYQNFKGHLTQLHAALEVLPLKHVAVGLGVDSMDFEFEGTSNSPTNYDLRGNVGFQYTGLQLYGKVLF